MSKDHKIDEAKYFYSRLHETRETPEHFRHELSAFLSAARSVLLYALEEVGEKGEKRRWYDAQVSARRVVRYLNGKRNLNVHIQPVSLSCVIHVVLSDAVPVFEEISIVLRDADGNVVRQGHVQPKVLKSETEHSASMETKYRFDDWPGSEDVLVLCGMYLGDIEAIVAEGRRSHFLA